MEAFDVDVVYHGCGNSHAFCRECLHSLVAAAAEEAAMETDSETTAMDADSVPTALDQPSITIACPLCRTRAPFSDVVPAKELVAELSLNATDCEACGEWVLLSALKAHRGQCAARATEAAREAETAHAQWTLRVRALRGTQGTQTQATPELDTNEPTYQNRSTFTCPLCIEDGTVVTGTEDHPGCHLDAGSLVRHLETHTGDANGERRAATCPICVAMPWGDPSYVSRDIAAHVRLRHMYDVTLFSDLEQGEEAGLQLALVASLGEGGGAAETESAPDADDTDDEEEDTGDVAQGGDAAIVRDAVSELRSVIARGGDADGMVSVSMATAQRALTATQRRLEVDAALAAADALPAAERGLALVRLARATVDENEVADTASESGTESDSDGE